MLIYFILVRFDLLCLNIVKSWYMYFIYLNSTGVDLILCNSQLSARSILNLCGTMERELT